MDNPFNLGLIALAGAQNPEAFSTAMSNLGISPSGGTGMAGGFMGIGQGLGQYLAPATTTGWDATVSPAAAQGGLMGGGATAANPLAALAGVKAPPPTQPIMSGGIAGAAKPPDQNIQALGMNPVMQAIMQLIQGGGAQAPGSLGSVLRQGTLK